MPSSRHCSRSASFCSPPRPALIRIGAPIGAGPIEFCEQSAVEDVPRLRGQRQQADQDVSAPQKRVEPGSAMKACDAVDLLFATTPSADTKAEIGQRRGGVRAERAEAHDADRNRARRPLKSGRPAPLALAGSQIGLLPMMHQHVQHDIFRHACGEIADRHPNQRHLRQAGIGDQRVDAGAEVENDAQIRKSRKLAWSRLPDRGIVDVGGIELRHRATAPRADRRTPRRTGCSIVRATSSRSRRARSAPARPASSDFRPIHAQHQASLPARPSGAK